MPEGIFNLAPFPESQEPSSALAVPGEELPPKELGKGCSRGLFGQVWGSPRALWVQGCAQQLFVVGEASLGLQETPQLRQPGKTAPGTGWLDLILPGVNKSQSVSDTLGWT